MFSLALKEIRFFKLKYFLIGLILFLIAALVFIVSGLAQGLALDNASTMEEMDAEVFYLTEDADHRLDRSGILLTGLTEEIDRDAGWQPFILHRFRLDAETSESKLDVTLLPVDPNHFLYPGVSEGESITASNQLNVVVDESLQADGIAIGDPLYDEDSDTTFTVIGFVENQRHSHTPVVFIAEEAFKHLEIIPNDVANAIALQQPDESMQAEIDKILSDGEWITKDDVIQSIPGYAAEQGSLMMMVAFLIVIAVFVLAAFFYILTIQKINQFGVLKAIGAKNSFLVGATMLQVFALTVISLAVAIGFTSFVQMNLPAGMPFVFDLQLIIVYSAILLTVSLLGALLSSINIVKVDPQQAMGRTE